MSQANGHVSLRLVEEHLLHLAIESGAFPRLLFDVSHGRRSFEIHGITTSQLSLLVEARGAERLDLRELLTRGQVLQNRTRCQWFHESLVFDQQTLVHLVSRLVVVLLLSLDAYLLGASSLSERHLKESLG